MVYSIEGVHGIMFALGLGITHSLINHGPSIFIGIPDENSPLITLPGKKLVVKGKGSKAFFTTYYGSITGVIITCLSLYPLYLFYNYFLDKISNFQNFMIVIILLYIILSCKNIIAGIITVFLGSLVGLIVFNINSVGTSEAFLPMFAGLFGTPILIKKFNEDFPVQKIDFFFPDKKNIVGGFKGFVAGIFSSVLPGIGPSSTATVLDTEDRLEFMSALGSVNTTNIITSIIIILTSLRSRTGLADFIISNYSTDKIKIFYIISVGFISSGLTFLLSKKIVFMFIFILEKIDENILKITIITCLLFLIIYFTGHTGVSIYFISTGVGLICSRLDAKKSLLMSCIIIPVLIL